MAAPELCSAIVELARVAAVRLAVRDARRGFARLTPAQRGALEREGQRRRAAATAMLRAWRTIPAASAAGRLGAMLPGDDDRLLLALAAAPQLDRSVARAFAAAAGGPSLFAGLLLDLAADEPEAQLALAARLHAQAPLRAAGILHAGDEAGALSVDAALAIVPAAVAALRAEPIARPDGQRRESPVVDDEVADGLARVLMLPRWRPGELAVVTGPAGERAAVLLLRGAIAGRPTWPASAAAVMADPVGWCRDAALAGAHLGVVLEGDAAPVLAALRPAAAATRAVVVMSVAQIRAELLARDEILVATELFRGASPWVSPELSPGPIRAAVTALGY